MIFRFITSLILGISWISVSWAASVGDSPLKSTRKRVHFSGSDKLHLLRTYTEENLAALRRRLVGIPKEMRVQEDYIVSIGPIMQVESSEKPIKAPEEDIDLESESSKLISPIHLFDRKHPEGMAYDFDGFILTKYIDHFTIEIDSKENIYVYDTTSLKMPTGLSVVDFINAKFKAYKLSKS